MTMKIENRKLHGVTQGSPEWRALRVGRFCASDAAAMMGCGRTKKRNELLAEQHSGISKDVSSFVEERVFAPGHAAEAAYRPIAEAEIGDQLFPVTITADVDGLPLLVSMDGLTMDDAQAFEHKFLNQEIVEHIKAHGEPPLDYIWQLEQQLLLSGAEKTLFVTSNGTSDGAVSCWYISHPERRIALLAGWRQFAVDLAAFQPQPTAEPKPIGNTPQSLPALRVEIQGKVTASNLADFKSQALMAIGSINRDLKTDQDFADAESAIKWCDDVEDRLKATREHILSQAEDIYNALKTLDEVDGASSGVRIFLSKLVKSRKDELRAEIVAGGTSALSKHIQALNADLGARYLLTVPTDFGGSIKSLRTLSSIRNAVDSELARAKIVADGIAERVRTNLLHLNERADHKALFPDVTTLALKETDDFRAVVATRIAEHHATLQRQAEAAIQALSTRHTPASSPAPEPAAFKSVAATPVAVKPVLASANDSVRIKLGEINARLAPMSITADGLSELGFDPVNIQGNAKLYRDSDWPTICDALIKRLDLARALRAA